MTTPKVATLSQGGSRYYVHPTTSEKVPGVTSVLNALPKPFLTPWSTKLVAEAAVDNLDAVAALAAADRQGAVDYLKGAPRRSTASSADLGTAAHGIFERMCLGQHVGTLTDEVMPFVKHFSNFFDTVQPEFIEVEQTVWSDTHKYGGSFDGLAKIDGVTCWLDLKTGKSIHADVALQLAAYAHAEVMLKEGDELPLLDTTKAGFKGPISTDSLPHGVELPIPTIPEILPLLEIMESAGVEDVAKVPEEELVLM